jgi:hypothetical protein
MIKQPNAYHHKSLIAITLMVMLVLVSLACSLGRSGSDAVRIRNILPTFTPTVVVVSQVAAPAEVSNPPANLTTNVQVPTATATSSQRVRHLPTLTPTPAANSLAQVQNQPASIAAQPTIPLLPNPTLALNLTLTPTPSLPPTTTPPTSNPNPKPPPPPSDDPEPTPAEVEGWSFRNVQTWLESGNALVVGELVNQTGAAQQEVNISGLFYNADDEIIQNEIETLSYVPVEIIPIGAHIPFELTIESIEPIYRLDLLAMSEPADSPPRQDFQFTGVSQWTDDTNMYCLSGQVKNLGSPLEDSLVIMTIGYNDYGSVVSFGEYSPISPEVITGDQTSTFETCLDPLNQQITRHELRAIGY